ncbi:MAG: hypothetical protein C00003105_00942 [ANME-2 cluster archaeon HR1]|nr:MAG: hypothetical protein C00003105_00942 [ANME-2 cluster archaeon HR1]
MKKKLAGRCSGVNGLDNTFKTDFAIFESVDQLDELPQATAQTIQPPDDQGVARPEIGKGFI